MSDLKDDGIRPALYAAEAVQVDLEGLLERTRARRESLKFEQSPLVREVEVWMGAVESYTEALLRKFPQGQSRH
jgi:hypothetical protein